MVTGGSRGIGRAIVQALAAEGAKVAFVYRGSKEAADAAVQEMPQAGGTASASSGGRDRPGSRSQRVSRRSRRTGARSTSW